jgi:hypothetical protein
MVKTAPAPNVEQRDYHETWLGKTAAPMLEDQITLAGEARTKLEAERTNA